MDRGVTLIEPAGSRQIADIRLRRHIGAAIEDYGPFDLGLVTVKAYDTASRDRGTGGRACGAGCHCC